MFLFRDTILEDYQVISLSLKLIYGISWKCGKILLAKVGIADKYFIENINDRFYEILYYLLRRSVISEARIIRQVNVNINKLIELELYKGIRHKFFYPTRGQRTRSNARTQRYKRFQKKK